MCRMEHYALLDYLEIPCDGRYRSSDMAAAFIKTNWRCAVLRLGSKRKTKNMAVALRKHLQKHNEPIACSIVGGMLVLERTDIGY